MEPVEVICEASNSSLRSRYDHFNRVLFQGQLPKITLRYVPSLPANTSEPISGQTTFLYRTTDSGFVTVPGSIVVEISNLFERTSTQIDGILVHEMIHVYFAHHNNPTEDHGPQFHAMLERFGQRLGFAVPITDDTDELTYSAGTSTDVGALLVKNSEGLALVALFEPNLFDHGGTFQKFQSFFSRHLGKPQFRNEYVFLRGRTAVGRRFRVNSSVTEAFGLFRITERDKDALLTNCRELARLDGRKLAS